MIIIIKYNINDINDNNVWILLCELMCVNININDNVMKW